ncbi:YciI family protein [Acinetobacter sp. MD2]|uniref:YciI family protein n=1 Tax=Acinetobacter sp. MD2 TaxID=2600066 RepID=UPI002D1F96D8|nr:YciI family protein [Acinetobacter sp. MD2]MEB3768249.1 hypothetical protein [Acinetobacter sp. MD2]
MALFIIHCTDKEGTLAQRLAVRSEHLARLELLNAEGRVIVAGPMPKEPGHIEAGFYGSVMIVDFESREALDLWLADEPYLKAGVYSHVDVKPFIQVFPKG